MDTKLCKDCANFDIYKEGSSGFRKVTGYCNRRSARISPVTGREVVFNEPAFSQRLLSDYRDTCGPSAKYFTPKPHIEVQSFWVKLINKLKVWK